MIDTAQGISPPNRTPGSGGRGERSASGRRKFMRIVRESLRGRVRGDPRRKF